MREFLGISDFNKELFIELLPEKLRAQFSSDLISCETQDIHNKEIAFTNGEQSKCFEYSIRKIGHKLKLSEGQFLITGIDITDVKVATNKLKEINQNLEKMVEERTEEYRIAKDEALKVSAC